MKKILKKKMSIEDLAFSINKGFKRVENLIEEKIDQLAISTAKGFENTATKDDIEGLKSQIQGVNNRIDDISMNRVKYEDHNKLKARVDFIERKLEIKS
ncbi:MAG: hypothetical protein WAN61_03670 [Minisyncoccia bacterium]